MKNLKKQTLAVIGGLTMIMNAGAALSSTTNASAIIDWSTFAITGYGLGSNAAPTYTLSGQSSNTSSSESDWLNWSSDTLNNSHSFGASTTGTAGGSGSASASRSANLNISGTGFLVISADYAINAAINENGGYSNNPNSANASVSFNLSNYSSLNTSGSSAAQANISLVNNQWWNYGNPNLTSDQKQGVLSVGVIVHDGDLLNFSSAVSATAYDNGLGTVILPPVIFPPVIFGGSGGSISLSGGTISVLAHTPLIFNTPHISAISAVPVPAAMWLFSSALVGLIGLGRHRKAVMA
jgi:hypothetical protein